MSSTYHWVTTLVVAVAIGVIGATSSLANGPVGELDVRGQVQIGQQGGDGAVTVRDTTYGWFSGDRVDTGSGHALLSLDAGGSFGFGQNTEASLSTEDGRISVALDAGVMLYAIEGEAAGLSVASGEYTFTTHTGEARAVPVASDTPVSAGMIEVLDHGEVRVSVQEGVMNAVDVTGALHYRVTTGEAVAFAGTEPRQVEVQVEAARRGDDDDDGLVAWMRNNPALTGLIVAAGAYGAYRVFFDDDDDDPEPVSP